MNTYEKTALTLGGVASFLTFEACATPQDRNMDIGRITNPDPVVEEQKKIGTSMSGMLDDYVLEEPEIAEKNKNYDLKINNKKIENGSFEHVKIYNQLENWEKYYKHLDIKSIDLVELTKVENDTIAWECRLWFVDKDSQDVAYRSIVRYDKIYKDGFNNEKIVNEALRDFVGDKGERVWKEVKSDIAKGKYEELNRNYELTIANEKITQDNFNHAVIYNKLQAWQKFFKGFDIKSVDISSPQREGESVKRTVKLWFINNKNNKNVASEENIEFNSDENNEYRMTLEQILGEAVRRAIENGSFRS